MIRIRWELEEAVALVDLYFKNNAGLNVSDEKLLSLSEIYRNRAQHMGLLVDSKFRNLAGLRLQLGCIHFVVTDNREGMSNVSQIFYEAYDLYKTAPDRFRQIASEFYQKYAVPQERDPSGQAAWIAQRYNKLVRDRIPEIIESDGKICTTEILSDYQYLQMLDAKLNEEMAEYQESKSLEELADLLEVMRVVVKARGWRWEQLEQVRQEKAARRGSFEKKILLKEIREK